MKMSKKLLIVSFVFVSSVVTVNAMRKSFDPKAAAMNQAREAIESRLTDGGSYLAEKLKGFERLVKERSHGMREEEERAYLDDQVKFLVGLLDGVSVDAANQLQSSINRINPGLVERSEGMQELIKKFSGGQQQKIQQKREKIDLDIRLLSKKIEMLRARQRALNQEEQGAFLMQQEEERLASEFVEQQKKVIKALQEKVARVKHEIQRLHDLGRNDEIEIDQISKDMAIEKKQLQDDLRQLQEKLQKNRDLLFEYEKHLSDLTPKSLAEQIVVGAGEADLSSGRSARVVEQLDEDKMVFGVFRGHTLTADFSFAARASRYAAEQIAKFIRESGHYQEKDMIGAMTDAFAQIDRECCDLSAGTTASVAVMSAKEKKLYLAHVGDARIVVVRAHGEIDATKPHFPTNEAEKDRIEAKGGVVANECVSHRDDLRGMIISRVLGDKEFKGIGVISEPEAKILDLTSTDRFMILGTSILWRNISAEKAVKFVDEKMAELGVTPRTINAAQAKEIADGLAAMGQQDIGAADTCATIVFFNM